jgi:hypothetical protein
MGLSMAQVLAQTPLQSGVFQTPTLSIDNLPPAPNALEIDQEGNFYLLETKNHRIHKYFKSMNYDSVLTIGGKGTGEEGFNQPTKLEVVNRQTVYLLDEINRRILLLNVNLKVIDDINFLDLQQQSVQRDPDDLWPISFASGPSGEFYLLNQENYKIYKYNAFGNLETTFGGLDYGNGSLEEPDDLTLNHQNYLFVSDSINQKITVFDLFGIFQYVIHGPQEFRYKQLRVLDNYLILFDEHHLFFMDLFTKRSTLIPMEESSALLDVAGNREYFYLLFENKVNLYAH